MIALTLTTELNVVSVLIGLHVLTAIGSRFLMIDRRKKALFGAPTGFQYQETDVDKDCRFEIENLFVEIQPGHPRYPKPKGLEGITRTVVTSI